MPKIEEIFAYIAEDNGPEDEGVVATIMGGASLGGVSVGGVSMPLIGADISRIDSLREIAKDIATKSGKTIRLCKFSVREIVEVIEPEPKAPAKPSREYS